MNLSDGMTRRDVMRWAASASVAASLAGCNRGSGGGIGVSLLNLANEFIVLIEQAMKDEGDKLGVKLIVNDAEASAQKQVQQVERFIAQEVDAIILNPCEVEASSPAVDKAHAAKIPIVNVNSETQTKPTAFVGSRDEESARLAMAYIAKRLGGKGHVVMMHGRMGQAAQIKRDRGAREILAKHEGLTLLAEQTANFDRGDAMALMERWLQSPHRDKINAVFAQNDEMAMGALLALEQAKQKDKVIVVGVDAISDALDAVQAGRLDATVFQDAAGQGRGAVRTAVQIIRGEDYKKETIIPFQLVTRENVNEFLTG